jgi:hypothetical protein
MLTPTDIENLKNFEKLKPNHKRVFKHRITEKCISSLKDIEVVLTYHEQLRLKINKILDIDHLMNLMEWYEKLCLLQNV